MVGAVSGACPAPGRCCPPGPTGPRPSRPALRGRGPSPGAELPHRRAGGAGRARAGTGRAALPAGPTRAPPPPPHPLPGPSFAGQRRARRPPPHLTSLGSRPVSLRIFSSTCLRLSLAFSSCSCSARTATAIPPAARPGRAPREAALGNRGDRPRPLRWPRAGRAQPIALLWPPLTANHWARGLRGRPSGWLAESPHQSQSPETEWHPGCPTSGRLFLLAGRINERGRQSDMSRANKNSNVISL